MVDNHFIINIGFILGFLFFIPGFVLALIGRKIPPEWYVAWGTIQGIQPKKFFTNTIYYSFIASDSRRYDNTAEGSPLFSSLSTGRTVLIYFNPSNPWESFIKSNGVPRKNSYATAGNIMTIIGNIFFIIACVLVIAEDITD